MIGSILQAELEELISQKKWDELRQALSVLEAPDVAEVIVDLPPEDEGIIFRVLPRDAAAQVFSYLPIEQQEQLIRSVSSDTSRAILDGMTPDDRARLLEEMPAEVTRRILETLSPDELRATRRILNYPEHSAGRYMTPEYVALRPEMTARDALAHVRATGRGKETLNVLYVVENGKLTAEMRLGTLVMADSDARIGDLRDRPLVSVQATSDREVMVELFEKYDRVALPVTDNLGNMLGIITADDVLDVAEMEATEDIQKMGGTEALDAPYLSVGFWPMVRKRGGWLAVLFLGEMLTATAMGYFEVEIEKAAVVALFVPLIISSGGNSGSQGTSLIIRSLALKELKLSDWWRVGGRELRTGLALGFFLGLIGFARIAVWQGLSHAPLIGTLFRTHAGGESAYGTYWALIGLTVFLALVGVVAWGSLAGSMLPFILRKLGFDPATSSAPFVATLVDVTGLIIYFTVAKIVLHSTVFQMH